MQNVTRSRSAWWRIRIQAVLALALGCGGSAPGLLAAPQDGAGAVLGGPPGGEALENAGHDEIPVSSPTILIGEVLVKSDALGRLAVVVAEPRPDAPPGTATRLFLLTPARPLADPIEERYALASVVFRGDSLHVAAPARGVTVDLALLSRSDGRHETGPASVVLHDGLALQSFRLRGTPRDLEAVSLDDRVSTVEPGSRVSTQERLCQAGNAGSSKCTKKCSFSIAGITITDECSVECTAGYYSCCNCDVHDQGATCECFREFVGPRQPSGARIDLY